MRYISLYKNYKINELSVFNTQIVKLGDVIKMHMDNGVILSIKKINVYTPSDNILTWEVLSVENESEEEYGFKRFDTLPDKIDILFLNKSNISVGTKLYVSGGKITMYTGGSPRYYCKIVRIYCNDKEVKTLKVRN